MSKISLIITREYISRIKQKSFIIITFLTPVLMALIVILPMLIMANQEKNVKKIAVIDESKQFLPDFTSSEIIKFDYLKSNPLISQDFLQENNYYAILVIPENFRADGIRMYSEQAIPIAIKQRIRYLIDAKVELQNLLAKNIDPQVIREAREHIPIQTLVWSESGELQQSVSEINTFMGPTLAFLIYMFTFVSGTQVMRGTMEEKTGRVMELFFTFPTYQRSRCIFFRCHSVSIYDNIYGIEKCRFGYVERFLFHLFYWRIFTLWLNVCRRWSCR